MRFATILLFLLSGCATTAVTPVAFIPTANTCIQVQASNFFVTSDAMPCYDAQTKLIGFGSSSGTSPAQMWSSAANATILDFGLPLAATAILK